MLSTKEIAERLGVTDGRVRQMLKEGKFPNAKKTAGGWWLIPKEDLKALSAK